MHSGAGRRRTGRIAAAVTVLAALVSGVAMLGLVASVAPAGAAERDLGPFRGLGTWVDAYDYAPSFQTNGRVPPVTPASVPDMAALGVHTLYLQVVKPQDGAPGPLEEPDLLGQFLTAAHRHDVDVVAWYLPTFDDPTADLAIVRAMVDFRAGRQRFDALSLDVEWTDGVRDPVERSDRAVALAKRTRALIGPDAPLGAAVYPAVQLEVLNTTLWPKFPYRRLAQYVDVWQPMTYWTFRDGELRDPGTYVKQSIHRLRTNLDDPSAVVAPIGGIADESTTLDDESFVAAVRSTRSIGWSLYDFVTTSSAAWPVLRSARSAPTTTTTTVAPAPAPAPAPTTTTRLP